MPANLNRYLIGGLLLALALPAVASILEDVHARGTVRVATTFDYRPFSFRRDGEPAGIDIDLALGIAHALGVRVEWITTSWPELTNDLRAGRFDVAMSGISITAERRHAGSFSESYYETGKTLLTRCGARNVDSLLAVDRPGVRVIVNPGGSNQRFVDAHIRHATVIVHPDNLSIFEALAGGAADVMITDAVEAQLESARHEALCMPQLAEWLEPVTKAWFTPRDAAWTRAINAVLESMKDDGTLAAIIERHVPAPPPVRP